MKIVVYSASSKRVDEVFLDTARRTGALFAKNKIALVCGGGSQGLMGASIDGALSAGGEAIGVIPDFMVDKGWCHPGLTEVIVTRSMHQRKDTMAKMSDAAIALPGGIGTLDELAEIMTWRQLGIYSRPVIIINTGGFYDPLIEMFEKMKRLKFMRHDNIPCLVASTPDEALEMIMSELSAAN